MFFQRVKWDEPPKENKIKILTQPTKNNRLNDWIGGLNLFFHP